MTFAKQFTLTLAAFCFSVTIAGLAHAQENSSAGRLTAAPSITVAASGGRVRFASVGSIERMRLEVFDASGDTVFDTGLKPGNVRDWRLTNAQGQRLMDGVYLCVVTVKELAGRLSFKQGNILIEGGRASLALDESAKSTSIEPGQYLSKTSAEESRAMTVVAHDGTDGQVTSTTGALSFRLGDFYSGREVERMRITGDGQIGIGTKDPQAALDVAGVIRARGGIRFSDGSMLTSAGTQSSSITEGPTPTVAGTGTTGKLVKWTNGPAGTLGDSVVTESSSNIGIGTATPGSKLHVVGAIQIGATSGTGVSPTLINPNNLANFAQVRFYPASGTNVNTSFAVVPKGTGQPNNRAQFSILSTDSVADPVNNEFATFRARGTDFVLGTGKTGAGQNRPLMLAAGFLSDNVTNNNQLVLATSGKVGVGTSAPITGKMHVTAASGEDGLYATSVNGNAVNGESGGTGVRGVSTGGGDGVFGQSASGYAGYFAGNVQAEGTVCSANISCVSDVRLKQGITQLGYGLHQVMRLRPVSWHWKAQPEGKLQMGLVAQEVEGVMPELVLRQADASKPLGLNYMGLLPVLVRATQEQQEQIEYQQSQLSDQRQLIEQLQTRLARVERVVKKRRHGKRIK